jgi:hypothetical protein
MLYRIKTVDGTKKKVPLAGSMPAGLPVGSILSTYKKIQPYNYLYCDGSTFDETQYPELYLYLGTNVLPDYRECVQVGAEKNTTDIFDSTQTDPSTGLPGTQSHDVFAQGEFKDDQIQNVEGIFYAQFPNGVGGVPTPNSFQIDTLGYPTKTAGASMNEYAGLGAQYSFKTSRVARAGTTTRTKEKAVYYYIKAVDGVDIADENIFLNTVVNTIQDAQSYSTTEQKTGGKWIDGKDIYRRVFYSATNWATGTVVGTINNIETVICLRNLNANGTGLVHEDYGADTSGNTSTVVVSTSTGEVTAYRTGVFANNQPSTVIIEYTKNE